MRNHVMTPVSQEQICRSRLITQSIIIINNNFTPLILKKKGSIEMLKETLKEREKQVAQIVKLKEKALINAPEGTLRFSTHGKGFQYYHYTSAENPSGVYIKKSEQNFAKALAQKEYDKKVLRSANTEVALLKQLNELYKKEKIEDIYEKMPLAKQELIEPIQLSDEKFVEQWEKQKYERLGFWEEVTEYYTDNGERVRSKSELMIANALKKKNIPYKYECPLELNSYGIVYPDFTVLNVKKRKEMYWEHFGLVDDRDYRQKNLGKLTCYETNNYFPGDKLILTFETAKQPLSSRLIERIIDKYL